MSARSKTVRSNGTRPLKVGETVRHALVQVLSRGEVHDLALQRHNITVTEVKMSPDLRHAHVFFTPFGGGDESAVLSDLKRCNPRIRTAVAQLVKLRYAPELHFQIDTSFGHADRIEEMLHSSLVARDLSLSPSDDDDDEDEDDDDLEDDDDITDEDDDDFDDDDDDEDDDDEDDDEED